jgi:hypothetical protein
MSNATPEELAQSVSTPTTFSFVDRLRGRNYPHDDVSLYLDEASGYRLSELNSEIANTINPDKLAKLEADYEAVRTGLAGQKYTVTLTGLSIKADEAMAKEAAEAYPFEYDEVVSPFTGEKTKVMIDSDDRNRLYTDLLWSASIIKVVDPTGAEQGALTQADVRAIREEGPREGVIRIAETIEKLKMATYWMDSIQDEDFLAKP